MIDFTYLHPMIVHFPIALALVGFLFELAGIVVKKPFLNHAGLTLLILGTLGAVAAYVSGNSAGEGIVEAGPLKTALETHEAAAELALWLMVAALVVRLGVMPLRRATIAVRLIPLVVFLAAAIAVGRAGHYGGQLVYNHAAGVKLDLGLGMTGSAVNKEHPSADTSASRVESGEIED